MMRGISRVAYTAVTGLLVVGAVSATMGVAHANFAALCEASSSPWTCTPELAATVDDVSAITVTVADNDATTTNNVTENVVVNWQVSCTDGTNGTEATASAPTVPTPATVNLTLPITADGQCSVTANVTLSGTQTNPSTFNPTPYNAQLNYTPAASPTATATATPTSTSTSTSGPPVHPIKGFDGKCVDDNGNSSANRAKVQIWTCSGTDQAENWTFSGNEFKHNGKCMNDQGNGGIRSHVILWTCNGASNEKWNELANGELQLQSHGGNLCLDDPRSSTTNGTQLIVYTCTDNANQKWSLP
jgi:hypothetical protein